MEFSDRGIPVLDLGAKVQALHYCIDHGHREDAMGHLFDLMANVQKGMSEKEGAGKPWGRDAILQLLETYGLTPTKIKDAEESQES